jgi:hypothetical protein
MRARWAAIRTISLGIALVLHGIGHSVLPLRGVDVGATEAANVLARLLYIAAIVGWVAAGIGLFGAKPFNRMVRSAAIIATAASFGGLAFLSDGDLWLGAVLNLVLLLAALRSPVPSATPVSNTSTRLVTAAGGLVIAWIGVSAALWPWHRQWGTTSVERSAALPGDPDVRQPAFEIMHGITIDASPDEVWQWLVQIGQDRAGFYSYDWLERLFQADVHNVDEIRPEWQHRHTGDFVRATQPNYLGGLLGSDLGWYVTEARPPEALVLHQWGAFVIVPGPDGRTRLLVRSTVSNRHIPVWVAGVNFVAFELPHFIMQRKMLLGIKTRAERSAA